MAYLGHAACAASLAATQHNTSPPCTNTSAALSPSPHFCPTGGDTKGSAKVEPYAYWPLDRRLMNRRAQKSKGAKQGLDKIVVAAKSGAAKGSKAKRQKQH